MKQVYIDAAGRMHSLYKRLMAYPPDGYYFITNKTKLDKFSSSIVRSNCIYSVQQRFLNQLMPVNLTKAYIEKIKRIPPNTDLTYATGQLIFRKEPWIVDIEDVTQFAGYNLRHFKKFRRTIEKTLASEYCRKITSYTKAGIDTVLQNLNADLQDKVEVIRPVVPKKKFVKDHSKEKVTLLFVGSANIPGNFLVKGGGEVLEAFAILQKSYHNIELIIRSDMPNEIKASYKKLDNLTLGEVIPMNQLENEFKSADIFLYPSHSTPALAILDAMSYELPVIATDTWGNPELVENGKTGFIINRSKKINYYVENLIPNWSSPDNMKAYKIPDSEVVSQLVEKTSILIEDEKLRRSMGFLGRKEVETGKFSIEKRNRKLKNIFDEATLVS